MNHADHVFWLGVSVADAVIDFREFGARISRDRRGGRLSLRFPLPLDSDLPVVDRAAARAKLGIAPDEVMLLSMGAPYKYRPNQKHDFFQTLDRVLAANPGARLYVIGVSPGEARSFGVPFHDRVELLGALSDPSVHEAAADLYLEGFPLNSYTALLETAARGVCPVLMYAPTPQIDLSTDAALDGLIVNTRNEDDYVAQVSALINNPAGRTALGAAVAHRIASINGADIGREYLQPIYERLSALAHNPASPPMQASSELEEDLDLAAFANPHSIGTALVRAADNALDRFSLGELGRMFAVSARFGDTRPTPSHARAWLGVMRRQVLSRRRTVGSGQ